MLKLISTLVTALISLFEPSPLPDALPVPTPIAQEESQLIPESTPTPNPKFLTQTVQETIPTVVLLPTATPLPTTNPLLVDECNSASLPLEVFAGESCMAKNINLRWINGRRDRDFTQSEVDEIMVRNGGDDLKSSLISQCYKVDKTRFEQCNSSIRNNAQRLVSEIISASSSEITSCTEAVATGDNRIKDQSARYLAKHKLKDRINSIYEYCYTNGGSVDNLHF